jgi:alkylated DNA repair dioxygenase AlkB
MENIAAPPAYVDLELPDGELRLWARAFDEMESERFFAGLLATVAWHQEQILMFGRRVPVPRLVAWHGDPGATYAYSGTNHLPAPWTPALQRIRERVHQLTGREFNAVLLNRYRGGSDGMGWHSDDEPELGRDPVLASVSFGATRRFCMRHRRRRDQRLDLSLTDGSLLCMAGATQHHWVHAVPKTNAAVGERLNLTFRRVRLT